MRILWKLPRCGVTTFIYNGSDKIFKLPRECTMRMCQMYVNACSSCNPGAEALGSASMTTAAVTSDLNICCDGPKQTWGQPTITNNHLSRFQVVLYIPFLCLFEGRKSTTQCPKRPRCRRQPENSCPRCTRWYRPC